MAHGRRATRLRERQRRPRRRRGHRRTAQRPARGVPELAEALAEVIDAVPDRDGLIARSSAPRAGCSPSPTPSRWRRRHSAPSASATDAARVSPDRGGWHPAPSAPWPLAFARHLDADWADLVSQTTTGVWRAVRARRPGGRRDRGSWPGASLARSSPADCCGRPARAVRRRRTASASRDAEAPSPVPSPSAAPVPAPARTAEATLPMRRTTDPTGDVEPSGGAPADLASIADALLTARSACGGRAGLPGGRARDARRAVPAGGRRSAPRRSDR